MWLGTVVHDAAEHALKTFKHSRFVGADELVAKALARADSDVRNSQNERYRFNPKRYPGFQEHYYNQTPQDPLKRFALRLSDRCERCTKTRFFVEFVCQSAFGRSRSCTKVLNAPRCG